MFESDAGEGKGDIENESTDVWLLPLDAREEAKRCWQSGWDWMVIGLSIGTIMVGLSLIATCRWHLYAPEVFYYFVATMTLEVVCLLVTGLAMLAVAAILGENSLIHSLSMFSIGNDLCMTIAYAVFMVWGFIVLEKLLRENNYSFETAIHTRDGKGISWERSGLLLYVIMTSTTCTMYTISRAPTCIGFCGYGWDKIKRKIAKTPIVEFYTQYNRGDEYYVRVMPVEEYASFVSHMPDPIGSRNSHDRV